MDQQDHDANTVQDSKQVHGRSSYYHADAKLPDDIKKLINQDVLLNDPNGPKLIVHKEEKPRETRTIEIKNYSFMNDGIWMKVIIDLEKIPELKEITMDNLKCEFGDDSFKFEAIDPKTQDKYDLAMPRTRELIFPDKSKYYIRKNKIYIALHKQKEGEWWTLKGV